MPMSESNKPQTITSRFERTEHADNYLKFRPTWSPEIIQRSLNYLEEKIPKPFHLAVDVGCGSGQNARPLGQYFEKVIGVDVSEAQITQAKGRADNPPNIEFKIGTGGDIPVPDNCADLVTCANVLHWLDVDAFFKEVDRILKPSGCVAIYGYYNMAPCVENNDEKNKKLWDLMLELDGGPRALGPYLHSLEGRMKQMYADIKIPYEDNIRDDSYALSKYTTLEGYMGYYRSISSYWRYIEKNGLEEGEKLLQQFQDRFKALLGITEPAEKAKVTARAPVVLLLGRKPSASA